ncbi:MAG: hypothetical protein CMH56_11320 [Myxococcales bacterium]|nr:hypothetical protein [Myxococcales bacterium]
MAPKFYQVVALYHFCVLDDVSQKQVAISQKAESLQIKGTLLLAREGINGTVAGTPEAIQGLLAFLESFDAFQGLEYKLSQAAEMPFLRLKVRIKDEIVTMGQPNIDPLKKVGAYVTPNEWNDLIQDPDVVLVDTRNDYEVAIGTFEGAINPNTESFREFPEWVKNNLQPNKDKKVAMFCTGGIRCEKATSYLLQEGFENVFHLKGGILKYLEDIPEQDSLWDGECFVFDQRVAIKHGLKEGSYDLCYGCRCPINADDKAHPHFEEGVCCPHCTDTLTDEQKARFRMRQRQMRLAKERGTQHIGSTPNPSSSSI